MRVFHRGQERVFYDEKPIIASLELFLWRHRTISYVHAQIQWLAELFALTRVALGEQKPSAGCKEKARRCVLAIVITFPSTLRHIVAGFSKECCPILPVSTQTHRQGPENFRFIVKRVGTPPARSLIRGTRSERLIVQLEFNDSSSSIYFLFRESRSPSRLGQKTFALFDIVEAVEKL